jgi:hypothetical protein
VWAAPAFVVRVTCVAESRVRTTRFSTLAPVKVRTCPGPTLAGRVAPANVTVGEPDATEAVPMSYTRRASARTLTPFT